MNKKEEELQIALGTHPNICKGCKRLNLLDFEVEYGGYCLECRLDCKDLI